MVDILLGIGSREGLLKTVMNCWLPLAPYVLKHVQICVLHACKPRRTADQSPTVYGQCSEICDNRNVQRVLVEKFE